MAPKTGRRKTAKKPRGRPRGSTVEYPRNPNGHKLTQFSSQRQPSTKVINGVWRHVMNKDVGLDAPAQRVVKKCPKPRKFERENRDALLAALRGKLPTPKTQKYVGLRPPRTPSEYVKKRTRAIEKAYECAKRMLPLCERKRRAIKYDRRLKRQRRFKPGWQEVAKLVKLKLFGGHRPTKNVILTTLRIDDDDE